jgi:hypothetical protein
MMQTKKLLDAAIKQGDVQAEELARQSRIIANQKRAMYRALIRIEEGWIESAARILEKALESQKSRLHLKK